MMFTCPVCGRLKCAYWPEHWVWKRGQTFYCSDQCRDVDSVRDTRLLNDILRERRARKREKRKEDNRMKKLTLEQKKKAVQIAFEGGDYLEYLRQCGSDNPSGMWWTIKENLKKADPKLYAMLPDGRKKSQEKATDPIKAATIVEAMAQPETQSLESAMQGMQDATNKFFGACADMGLNVGKEEPVQAEPEQEDLLEIVALRGEFGEYKMDGEKFVFRDGGDFTKIEIEADDLMDFLAECTRAAKMLGVSA